MDALHNCRSVFEVNEECVVTENNVNMMMTVSKALEASILKVEPHQHKEQTRQFVVFNFRL